MEAVIRDACVKKVGVIDALWALIQCQSKSVQRTLAKRLNAQIEEEKQAKARMTEEEFYAKIDSSLESAKAGKILKMNEGETTDEFLDRILCIK